MLNWWLIVTLIVVALVCVGVSIYILFYFVSEEDDGEAYFAKFLVVFSMVISMGIILLLPFDVANSNDPTVLNKYNNTLNLQLMWMIVFWILMVMALIVIPFVMFFYEAYDPDEKSIKKQVVQGVIFTLVIFVGFAVACIACYFTVGVSYVPMRVYSGDPQLVRVQQQQQPKASGVSSTHKERNATIKLEGGFTPMVVSAENINSVVYTGNSVSADLEIKVNFSTYCIGLICFISWIVFFFYGGNSVSADLEIKVNFSTYCIGLICFISWIVFFFYGGIGLVYLPFHLISSSIYKLKKRKKISKTQFLTEMALIGTKADALLELALDLQKKCRPRRSSISGDNDGGRGSSSSSSTRSGITMSQRNKINILRNETYVLEAQQDQLIWAYTKRGGSLFIIYGYLLLGIISTAISLVWILHIFLYNIFDVAPFLNDMLVRLDNVFVFFGIIMYGVFVYYLLWATFEGQLRLGMRLVFFQIHPLRRHDTLLNSLLFNVALSLLTCPAIIQFASRSFQEYNPRSSINALMNIYVIHLKGIGEFIKWAQLCVVGVCVLATIWVILCPTHKKIKDPTKIRL